MFEAKEPINPSEPFNTTGAPMKDHTNYYGKGQSPEELRSKLLNELDHLEEVKLKAIDMGHQSMATSVSKQQREIRQVLNELNSQL